MQNNGFVATHVLGHMIYCCHLRQYCIKISVIFCTFFALNDCQPPGLIPLGLPEIQIRIFLKKLTVSIKEPKTLTQNNQQSNFFRHCLDLVTGVRTQKKDASINQPNLTQLIPYWLTQQHFLLKIGVTIFVESQKE